MAHRVAIVALLVWLASLAPALATPLAVEVYRRGALTGADAGSLGVRELYAERRALLVAGDGAADGPARGELRAWLTAAGFAVSELDYAADAPPAQPLLPALDAWLGQGGASEDALLLIVVDAPLTTVDRADAVITARDAGPTPLSALTQRLAEPRIARHAVLALSQAPARLSGRAVRAEALPLDEDAFAPARTLLYPERAGEPLLGALSDALRGDLGDVHDPDAFVSLGDILAATRDLSAFSFTEGRGTPVIGVRRAFETDFVTGRNPRESYRAVRRSEDAGEIARFAAERPDDDPLALWAHARLGALRARASAAAAARCDRALAFDADALLELGPMAVGALDGLDRPALTAAAWLASIADATGVDRDRAAAVLADCAAAGAPEPDLALRVATLGAGYPEQRAQALALAAPQAERSASAATLAALALLAQGGGDGPHAATVRAALKNHAFAGAPAARLVLGLGDLTSPEGGAQALNWVRQAAEGGMPLARAVFATATLSQDPRLATLRAVAAADVDLALRHQQSATRRGVLVRAAALADGDIEALQRARAVERCAAALGFDAATLLDPWTWTSEQTLAAARERPTAFARQLLAQATIAGWRRRCDLSAIAGLASEPLRTRLALAFLAEGDEDRARAVLAQSQDGESGLADALRALMTWRADPTGALLHATRAEAAGRRESLIVLSLIEPTPDRLARLRELAQQGMPMAQYALARALLGLGAPFGAVEALLWLRRAQAAGFEIAAERLQTVTELARADLPGALGLTLARPTAAELTARGYFNHSGAGALVVAVRPGSPAADKGVTDRHVLSAIGDVQFGDDVPQAQRLMLEALLERGFMLGRWMTPGETRSYNLLPPEALIETIRGWRPQTATLRLPPEPQPLRAGPGEAFAEIAVAPADATATALAPGLAGDWAWVRVAGPGGAPMEGFVRGALAAPRPRRRVQRDPRPSAAGGKRSLSSRYRRSARRLASGSSAWSDRG